MKGAGRRRSRVTLNVNNASTGNQFGQQKPNWQPLGTYWAEVDTTGGDETMNADQLKAAVTTKVTMRQVAPIVPGKYQLTYAGRTFNIISVIKVDNLNVFYEIMCKELVGGQ